MSDIPTPLPEPNTEEAVDFLDHVHPGGPWNMVFMEPDRKPVAVTIYQSRDDDLRDCIEKEQGQANVYFHVNRLRKVAKNRKAKKEDVSEIVALHVDVDDLDALDRILNFSPKPTAVVNSGGGYQAFWMLQSPSTEIERVESCNKVLAIKLGGDNCHNVDRIMRVPGTINLPNAKKRAAGRVPVAAKLVEADWTRRSSLDDFPNEPEPGPTGPKGSVAKVADIVPVDLGDLPSVVSEETRIFIERGDDPQRPISGPDARFPSRSEAVFRVACDLARHRCSDAQIAGVLINSAYGISESIREKKQPKAYALRQAHSALAAVEGGWPDVDKSGNPRPTMRNSILSLHRMGFSFSHDHFRHRKYVNGQQLEEFQGEIGDDACAKLRGFIIDQFDFDPKAENVRDAVNQLCLENTFHPIRQMLDSLTWDGLPRLDEWLTTYLGAEDNDLNRAIGRIMLLAAVRRVRVPGMKFDTIIILEGKQGTGKSTALMTLAGEENHSDNEILTLDTKAQMEAMEGIWIYELSEISGLRKADIERLKAFASRQRDKARMAYGRFSESRSRQAIFVGTTNEDKYLRDLTGNRRFLPVKTGFIDLEALRRDRDQLWAEASHREAKGESIILPEDLWEAAAAQQNERLEEDPWLEQLEEINGKAHGDEVRVYSKAILSFTLGIEAERQHVGQTKRLAGLMHSLGWETGKFKVNGKTVRGFKRPKPPDHVDDGDAPGHPDKGM